MANGTQFNLGSMSTGIDFSGMNFGSGWSGASVEQLLNQLTELFANLMDSLDDIVKDEYRKQLNEAALASGGVITARESELIEKAVNGTITQAEEQELVSLFPPNYFESQTYLAGRSVGELIALVSQPLSPGSAAAAIELRNRASVDGYVSPELNALLNHARLNGGLTDAQQERLYQLMLSEDAL